MNEYTRTFSFIKNYIFITNKEYRKAFMQDREFKKLYIIHGLAQTRHVKTFFVTRIYKNLYYLATKLKSIWLLTFVKKCYLKEHEFYTNSLYLNTMTANDLILRLEILKKGWQEKESNKKA